MVLPTIKKGLHLLINNSKQFSYTGLEVFLPGNSRTGQVDYSKHRREPRDRIVLAAVWCHTGALEVTSSDRGQEEKMKSGWAWDLILKPGPSRFWANGT